MPTGIKNVSLEPLPLPPPYEGMLPPGQIAVVADTPAQVQFILGGFPYVNKLVQTIVLPTGAALTIHGAANLDEYLSATGAAGLLPQTTRVDPATAGSAFTVSLANGLYAGHRKRFAVTSTGNSVTIKPGTMAESKSQVVLSGVIGTALELEWQIGPTAANQFGWKVILAAGPTAGVAAIS